MDATALRRRLHRCARGFDILRDAPGQAANNGPLDFSGDLGDCLEIPITDDGEAGFDYIDVQSCQLAGDLHLLPQVHGCAGTLFPVAQGGVENDDFV